MQRGKVWFRRAAADCAVGLIRSANVLLRGLHLQTALGSRASRMRQEFNESSEYRESSLSLYKIITFLWDQALGKPKPKGDVCRPITTSISYCAVHKTYQPSDPQQRRCLTPRPGTEIKTHSKRAVDTDPFLAVAIPDRQVTVIKPNPSSWSASQDGCPFTVPSVLLISSRSLKRNILDDIYILAVGVSVHQMQNSTTTSCDVLYGKTLAAAPRLLTRTTPLEQLW